VTQVKELAKIPNPRKTGKASKKPSPKGGRKLSATQGTKTAAGRGAARLRNHVNTTVDKKSERADHADRAAIDKTCDGNMTSARLIVELSGAQRAGPETKTKKKRGPQPWVKRICSEPEWEGPWEDEDTRRDAS
jgi:hypothetical protein